MSSENEFSLTISQDSSPPASNKGLFLYSDFVFILSSLLQFLETNLFVWRIQISCPNFDPCF